MKENGVSAFLCNEMTVELSESDIKSQVSSQIVIVPPRIGSKRAGSCPESLVARGQARLSGVAGSNPPGSVSTSLSDSSVSVSLIHACGGIIPCV